MGEAVVGSGPGMLIEPIMSIQAGSLTKEGDDYHDDKDACPTSSDIIEEIIAPNTERSELSEMDLLNTTVLPEERIPSTIQVEVATRDLAMPLDQTAISNPEGADESSDSTSTNVGSSEKHVIEDSLISSPSKRPRLENTTCDADAVIPVTEESQPSTATESQISPPSQGMTESVTSKDGELDVVSNPVLHLADNDPQRPDSSQSPENSLSSPEASAQNLRESVQQLDELHLELIYCKSSSNGERICRLCWSVTAFRQLYEF